MIYEPLFERQPDRTVRAGIIGLGEFATATFTQAQAMRRLSVPVISDTKVEAALTACAEAGIDREDIEICDDRAGART